MQCQLKCCLKCGGDLIWDSDAWRCWQCGRYYLRKNELPDEPFDALESDFPTSEAWVSGEPRRRRCSLWTTQRVNAVIESRERQEEQWLLRNRGIIANLDEGRSVQEVSFLTGISERKVRDVRERLNDLRNILND